MLDKSSIGFVEKDEIMNSIKIAQSELKLNSIDEINVDVVAKDVLLYQQVLMNKKQAQELQQQYNNMQQLIKLLMD